MRMSRKLRSVLYCQRVTRLISSRPRMGQQPCLAPRVHQGLVSFGWHVNFQNGTIGSGSNRRSRLVCARWQCI